MKPVLHPESMRQADRTAIEQYGIPSLLLMENAARSAAEIIRSRYALDRTTHVTILCGNGNNGGDGFALARHLHESVSVTLVFCGDPNRMTHDAAVNYRAACALGIEVVEWNGRSESSTLPAHTDFIVDALLGVGARGAPREPMATLVGWANEQQVHRIALDVPTGLDADSGAASEPCFRAELTITMGALKTGLLVGDGPDVCGEIEIAPIGIPYPVLAENAAAWLLDRGDLVAAYRRRSPRTTKFDYGRVVVVAGSEAMPGAAALCANAAVAAGAGLVELVTPAVHAALFPEVMPHRYDMPALDRGAWELVSQRLEKATAVVVGPGIGDHLETIELVGEIIAACSGRVPLVLDADALRAVRTDRTLRGVTLTPHRGELARILGVRTAEIARDAHLRAQELAKRTAATVVLKDFPVQIADSERTYWATWYNPALATGGTGDVLAGIIAALWAQGYSQFDAAWMGVALHAEAGRIAAERHGELATRASHLIEALGTVGRNLLDRQ